MASAHHALNGSCWCQLFQSLRISGTTSTGRLKTLHRPSFFTGSQTGHRSLSNACVLSSTLDTQAGARPRSSRSRDGYQRAPGQGVITFRNMNQEALARNGDRSPKDTYSARQDDLKNKSAENLEDGSRPATEDAEGDSFDQKREQWQIQKAALQRKFGNKKWQPRKRLSPDAIEGIRALHAQFPDRYTTPILAHQFEVSPEAIRRILKSKWRPSAEEAEKRNARWDRRGEKIWSQMVELGVKPPKKWREMGIGKRESPQTRSSGGRAARNSSFDSEDIPWADDSRPQSDVDRTPLSDRIL